MNNRYEAALNRLRGLSVQSTMDGFYSFVEHQDVLTAIEALQLAQEAEKRRPIKATNEALLRNLNHIENLYKEQLITISSLTKERDELAVDKYKLADAIIFLQSTLKFEHPIMELAKKVSENGK